MLWVGISIGGCTDLYIMRNDSLMAQKYADEVLRCHVLPQAAAIGNSSLLMQDNARLHTARLVENFLETEKVEYG